MKKLGAYLVVALAFFYCGEGVGPPQRRCQSIRVRIAWTNATTPSQGQPRGYVQYTNYCSMCHGEGVGQARHAGAAGEIQGQPCRRCSPTART